MQVNGQVETMDKVNATTDFSHLQDTLGHLMRYKLYTPICICFPLQDDSSQARIVNTLTKGLERLANGFPWVAGLATLDAGSRLPTVIPGEQKCRLVVKDLTEDPSMPSYHALRQARYPFSMLDGTVLTPVTDLPTSWDADPVPVFILQANFVKGGLLLVASGEHSTMDGVGLGRLVHMLSKACHGKDFTQDELLHGNSKRLDAIPLLDMKEYQPGPEVEHMLVKARPEYTLPKCTLGYFHFSPENLEKLKRLASASDSISDSPAVPYTTTNDAVSAFIWKCATRARGGHLAADATSMFIRAVDVRPCLSISPHYLGNMTHHTYTKIEVASADSISLYTLATILRSALNSAELAYGIRSLATLLATTEDKSKISYGADINMTSDIWFSSWAKLDCYNLDFNLGLGLPEAVRKPKMESIEGLMYLMPMDREGGIDAAVCLIDTDMERLMSDKEWLEYAEWIG